MINKFIHLLFFALPVLVLLAIFYPVVFSDSLFGNGDTLFGFYPYHQYFTAGGPLVAQGLLSGFPVYVSNVGVWFSWPYHLALNLFDAFDAYRYLTVFYLILAYGTTYGLARVLKFNHWLAVFASSVFLFSGQLMVWAPTLTNASYYYLLPLAPVVYELFRYWEKWWRWILPLILGGLLGVGWQTGHIQYLIFIHIFVAAYLIYKEWLGIIIFNKKTLITTIVYLGLVYLSSFAVGFKVIVSTLLWSKESARVAGVALSEWLGGSYNFFDLIHLAVPFWKHPFIPLGSPGWYLGLLPLVLIVLFAINWRYWSDGSSRFFFGVWFFCLIASLAYSPLAVFLHYLPFIDSLREASRLMFIGNLGGALVATQALGKLIASPNSFRRPVSRRVVYWLIGLVLFISLITTVVYRFFLGPTTDLVKNFFNLAFPGGYGSLPPDHYLRVLTNAWEQLLLQSSWFSLGTVSAIVSLVLIAWWFNRLYRYRQETLVKLAILITLIGFLGAYGGNYQFVSRGVIESVPATARFIKQSTAMESQGPFRVFSLWPGFTLYDLKERGCKLDNEGEKSYQVAKELLLPNSHMLYGIEMIDGYDNFMPKEISEFNAYIGSEQSVTGSMLSVANLSHQEKIAVIASRANLLKALNIRYILSYYPLTKPFVRVKDFKLAICDQTVSLYENPGYWPRYFWIDRVRVVSDDEFANFDFMVRHLNQSDRPTVIIPGNKSNDYPAPPQTEALIPEIKSKEMVFDLSGLGDGYIYIGNSHANRWRADIDGRPTEVYPANYAYLAVPVSAGDKILTLKTDYLFAW